MPDFPTEKFTPNFSQRIKDQVYNGIDCCVTLEVFNELHTLPEVDLAEAQVPYNFVRAMQAPALELMLRGIRVDPREVRNAIKELNVKQDRVQSILDKLASAVWGKGLNPRSSKQLQEFFYEVMGIEPVTKYVKGEKKVTTDRDAIEKISAYFYAQPFCNCILQIREYTKKISVLETEIDSDGRMRTSYNIAGTETARWSSSESVWGTGNNLQNITSKLRRIFIADDGWKLGYIDKSQAESRILGWLIWGLFEDPTYLDACESSDLHTVVAKLVWTTLPWTGDLAKDREIAEQIFYRDFSYRDMSKRGGHGTNYLGTAVTMAKHLKVAVQLIENFQAGYFHAFPGIQRFHRWVKQELNLNSRLTTILGRTRYFFARSWDDATLREGVAFLPQSILAELLNLALWRVWYHVREIQILAQVHDAILFQYREEDEDYVLPLVRSYMPTPFEHNGRTFQIPSDIEVGWNWSKYNDPFDPSSKDPRANFDGMKKWKGSDGRSRTYSPSQTGRLDLILS